MLRCFKSEGNKSFTSAVLRRCCCCLL